MMMHATSDELELYVTERLSFERAAWLEHHCEECAACARAVAGEASLELALRSMAGERRCGMRADAVVELPVERPAAPRPMLYALAAVACMALAFVAARLPSVMVQQPATQELFADAGDLAKVSSESPAWAEGEPSGGTP